MPQRLIKGELGAFGGGMGLRMLYIQCALTVQELLEIKLAEELPGSDEWPVRDLFQRDVDHDRVKKAIVPWLRDVDKIKFFAPITLALLPYDSATTRLDTEIPVLDSGTMQGSPLAGSIYEIVGDEFPKALRGRATVKWDPGQAHLVALDGQHRVAALRAVLDGPAAQAAAVMTWSVPAVVMCVFRERTPAVHRRVSYLDVARSVFVYINTQARAPSRARQILLNDESASAILAQEFVQHSHAAVRGDLNHFPLSAIQWRDGTEAGIGGGHKLLALPELYDICDELLLGGSRETRRKEAAQSLTAGDPKEKRLQELLCAGSLNPEAAHELRTLVRTALVPAIAMLFVGLSPFREFAQSVGVVEERLEREGVPGAAALTAIRIGGAGNWRTREEVARLVGDAVRDLERSAQVIPKLFRDDIGLRGAVSGFAQVLPLLRTVDRVARPTTELVASYVAALNGRISEGWLVGASEQMSRHLRHITRNEGGTVKNYRFDEVPDALGALCASIAATALVPNGSANLRAFLRDCLRRRLFETVRQGYVGELRRRYRDNHSGWSVGEVKDRAQADSRPRAGRHIDNVLVELGLEVTNV